MHHLIIGAGISGLTLGWLLKQKGDSVTLLEKNARAGGWIQTLHVNGFLFEQGPRSLKPHPATRELLERLEIETIDADPSAKKRYIYTKGKLRSVPFSFLPMILKGAYHYLTSSTLEEDETVHDFCVRRFGKPVAETLADALVSGIYAGNTRHLSMKSCFPHAFSTKGSIYTCKGGMQTLVDALAKPLTIQYGTEVEEVTAKGARLTTGEYIDADRIHIAMPLRRKGVTVATVNVGYRTDVLKKKGFGYLIPSKEKEQILGVVFDSSVFPQNPEETRLTVMIGGAHFPEIDRLNEKELIEIALHALSKHLGINEAPDALHVRIAKNAIPQYGLGHEQRVREQEESFRAVSPKISLLGNEWYGVSVNDCIQRAFQIYKS